MDPCSLLPEGVRSLVALLPRDGYRVVATSPVSEGEEEGFTGSAVVEEPSGPVAFVTRGRDTAALDRNLDERDLVVAWRDDHVSS